jgi:hypothetical protein
MADNQVLAAILTVALNSTKPGARAKQKGKEAWRQVWNDYKTFLKEMERSDNSIDKRGINPD